MNRLGRWRQAVTFYLVGLLNTGVDVALFVVLGHLLGLPYLLAQALSYTAGAANSYVLNRLVTFRLSGRPAAMETVRFAVVNALSLGASAAVLYIVHGALGGDMILGKALATVAGSGLNYMGSRYWVFRAAAPGEGNRRPLEPLGEVT